MAQKKSKNIETTEEKHVVDEKITSVNIKDCRTKELIDYLSAIESICSVYERSVRLYDGTIADSNSMIARKIASFTVVRDNILAELEYRILNLK